jgi:hypothetical protein
MISFGFWKSETFIPFSISWTTSSNNSSNAGCEDGGWVVNSDGDVVRFNVSDSANCGGSCSVTQTGTATANITTGTDNINMQLNIDGMAELQDPNFERIRFFIDDVEIANATSAGGGLGCTSGPVVKNIIIPGPYLFLANTSYEFKISFTTGDALFHVDSFYEINLSFTKA